MTLPRVMEPWTECKGRVNGASLLAVSPVPAAVIP